MSHIVFPANAFACSECTDQKIIGLQLNPLKV